MKHPLLICLLSSASLAAMATAALADPSARVGRVAYTEGEVSFQPPQSDEWTSATRNFPVAPGEAFWTGDDGRAELQIGSVDTRLDSETELDVLDVDYGDMRLALPQGSADLRLWSNPDRPVIIATPAGDVRLDSRGLYRIDVGAPAQDGAYPPVEVTVFEGAAEAPSHEGMAPVQAGQAALIYAGYDPQFQYAENAAIDDWGRDLETRTGWRPNDDSSAALTGYGDLYAAGDFSADPQYGQVWFPRDVPSDWAPYRDGHWAYVEPWGYTWIDDEPWGFAPFHYGRWTQIDGRWGWIPGAPTRQPVYAPALVAFFGGAGWRLGDSDAIGWAPLAPDEDYRPGYVVSDGYRRRLNEGSVREGYRDRGGGERPVESYRNAHAATVVRATDFSGARPVRAAALTVTPNMIAAAPVAPPQAHPAPTPWARTGLALRQGAGGPSAPPPPTAARPPQSLAVVRRAVVAPPPAPGRPPVIAGARIAPPAPPPAPGAGRPAPAMIAPAQLRHPQPPSGQPMPPSRPAYTGAPAAAPARPGAPDAGQRAAEAQAATRAQAAARAQAEQARQAQMQQAQTQQARDAAARVQADQARQAQAQAAARVQAEQAQAREAQAQAARAQADQARQAQAQAAARAQADQAHQAQMQMEQARRAQAAGAAAAKPQSPQDPRKQNDRPPPQP